MAIDAREITEPIDLQLPSGVLNPDAVGWTRAPLHRTGGDGSRLAVDGLLGSAKDVEQRW
jgi:hypothetical protein